MFARALLARAACAIGSGGIVVAVSEFWFYEISAEVSHWGILALYAVLTWTLLAVLDRFDVSTRGAFTAAVVLGLLQRFSLNLNQVLGKASRQSIDAAMFLKKVMSQVFCETL